MPPETTRVKVSYDNVVMIAYLSDKQLSDLKVYLLHGLGLVVKEEDVL